MGPRDGAGVGVGLGVGPDPPAPPQKTVNTKASLGRLVLGLRGGPIFGVVLFLDFWGEFRVMAPQYPPVPGTPPTNAPLNMAGVLDGLLLQADDDDSDGGSIDGGGRCSRRAR